MADSSARRSRGWTAGWVVALYLPYFALNLAFPGPVIAYGGGVAIAAASIGLTWLAGERPRDALLRCAPPSRTTVAVLGAAGVGALAISEVDGRLVLPTPAAVLAAVTSAGAQEVYFRGTLMRALQRVGRPGLVPPEAVQSGLFSIWHLRAFAEVTPLEATAVVLVSFVAGYVFAVLAWRDRTLLWVALAHAALLAFQ